MNILHHFAHRLFYRVRSVPIRDCVHYCGFRYGRGEFNPYEEYFRGLASGEPMNCARARLRDFLLHYRPQDLAQALSLDIANAPPLWQFPWNRVHSGTPKGWRQTADEIPDVLTHFSDEGVPEQRIHDEYGWLEGAWRAISSEGYLPGKYSYVRVFELVGSERSAYIVADGNHRLAALSTLGVERIEVILAPLRTAHRARNASWPAVRDNRLRQDDALRIFDAYFHGNQCPHRTKTLAPVWTSANPARKREKKHGGQT
ncbi:hypothetical protein [Rhodanobacter sp. KK11]|jgi:hypothetical protein|uniref:hypothetical protein n=1 Tax=Rhodanobacter sp. KK11 TaxID=3083255 RepID=UPI0029662CE4|nr:hypothetical protein [Rhodanobacter sp. KK11]MDW2980593.1 hypothetical protein [Rhodanobacter sp. KK11]